MNDLDKTALLPCPWCGDPLAPVSVVEGSTFRWRRVHGCCADGPEVHHDTKSDDQQAAEVDSRRRAIEAWNARAAPPGYVLVPADELQRVIGVLRYGSHPHPSPHADALAALCRDRSVAGGPREQAPAIDLEQLREGFCLVLQDEFDLEAADPEDPRHDDGRDEALRVSDRLLALIDGQSDPLCVKKLAECKYPKCGCNEQPPKGEEEE